jgi:hypothetical protein
VLILYLYWPRLVSKLFYQSLNVKGLFNWFPNHQVYSLHLSSLLFILHPNPLFLIHFPLFSTSKQGHPLPKPQFPYSDFVIICDCILILKYQIMALLQYAHIIIFECLNSQIIIPNVFVILNWFVLLFCAVAFSFVFLV